MALQHVSFSTLAQTLGVNPLTGEACALSMRILCDVNEQGAALLREYFGLPTDCKLSDPWNSKVGNAPAVASFMIDRKAFPALVHFALLRAGCQYVYGRDDEIDSTGFSDSDLEEYPDLADYISGTAKRAGFDKGARLYRNWCAGPAVGTRNVHAASSRVA
jgi:hypothetical protein